MALSASDQILLQQSLSQLAQSASSVARYSSALNNAQQTSATATGNLSKIQTTSVGDFEKLSKTLKSNAVAFKDTIKNINDYSKKVQQTTDDYKTASDNLNIFNQQIAAAGGMMTNAQRATLASLNSILASAAEEQSRASTAHNNAFNIIADIVQSTRDAIQYRNEYEKDFFGRQLASEVRSSLESIAGQTAGTFSKQLLTMSDVTRVAQFAEAQSELVKSMMNNSNIIDDSNAELGKKYIEMGKAIGYTSTEFESLRTRIEGRAAGSASWISQGIVDKIMEAQVTIADTINKSNEKIATTFDRDIKSFTGQFNRYMHENRNGFDEMLDELRDIRTRTGSLTSGAGREEAGQLIRESINKLGGVIVPKLAELGFIVLKHFTREYDSLTRDNVATNRVMAWQLRLTEEEYRQSRGESKSFWNITSAEGQNQLDTFINERYSQLRSVFGSDPIMISKMGSRMQGLVNLSNLTSTGVDSLLSSFKVLGKSARMNNDVLAEMYLNIAESNENQVIMASLNAKDRKARMDSIATTMAFGAGLGMTKESLEEFTKAMVSSTSKLPSAGEAVSNFGQALTAFNFMKSAASLSGVDISKYGLADSKQMQEYLELKQRKDAGVPLTAEQTMFMENMNLRIAEFKAEAKANYNEIVEKYGSRAGLTLLNTLNLLDEKLDQSKMSEMIDPITKSLTAIGNFGFKDGKIPQTLDELNSMLKSQAESKTDKTAEDTTLIAAEAQRTINATTGEGLYSDIGKLGTSAVIGGLLTRYAVPMARAALGMVASSPISKVTPVGWAATLAAGAGLYALNKFTGSEESEKPKAEEAPKTTTPTAETQEQVPGPLPTSKIQAAETNETANEFNTMFSTFMKNVEAQNNITQDFLRNMSMNSSSTKKVMEDWYDLYQQVNTITPIIEPNNVTDTSRP